MKTSVNRQSVDLEAMERWTRSPPHRDWWQTFLNDSGGTGFWHETYFMGGGMEAIYDDVPKAVGTQVFAPAVAARGPAGKRVSVRVTEAAVRSIEHWASGR